MWLAIGEEMGKLHEYALKFFKWTSRVVCCFSLRHLVAALGLLLTFAPFNLSQFTILDRSLAYLVTAVSGYKSGPADIAVVLIDDAELERWQGDLYRADKLSLLVSNVLHSSRANVGIVFEDALNLRLSDLDQYISSESDVSVNALQIVQQKQYLIELLKDSRVTLGLLGAPLEVEPINTISSLSPFADQIRATSHYFSACEYCNVDILAQVPEHWYWVPPIRDAHTLAWYGDGKAIYPTFYSAFHFSRSGQPLSSLAWDGVQALSLDERTVNTSAAGKWLAAHVLFEHLSPRKIVLDYAEAVSVNAFPNNVFIGAEKNKAQLFDIADALYSSTHQHYFYSAGWLDIGLRIAVLFITLYCVFLQARIKSLSRTLVLPGSLVVVGIVAVVYFAITQHIWLSVSYLIIWLLLATFLIGLWQVQTSQKGMQRTQLDHAVSDASYALEKGENYSEAISLLAHHSDSVSAIDRVCQLGGHLARDKGEYDQAITLLSTLAETSVAKGKIERHVNILRREHTQSSLQAQESAYLARPKIPLPEQLGRYQVERELGRGAVGVVYLGFDPAISRKVAIKTLDTSQFSSAQTQGLKARFFREAEAAGRLNHPNIVSIYDVGEQDDLTYIAMDYVSGAALNEHIDPAELLPVSDVYRIIYDVALALEYAHKHQIVHRDIKPSNIMYSESPYMVKVADFGIARLLDNSKTSTGEILGSPLYMAPEQLKGSKVDATADIFSIGVTFYQLLTGQLPFNADNLASLTYEIIHTRHKNVRTARKDLPPSAARIVNQCLQKDPQNRYQSAIELALIIKKAIKRDFPAEARSFGLV